ncbi:MAG: carboxymuconolactone decarboxylase family protein [Balneolaceae bacterium]|nr:carboxymuconolactone decarboxylase family protein [Balneolaceae bacterium]
MYYNLWKGVTEKKAISSIEYNHTFRTQYFNCIMNALQTKPTNTTNTPRLTPIEQPSGLKLKLAYYFTKSKLGKTITPLKVTYARVPAALSIVQAFQKTTNALTLDPELALIIKSFVATQNGCSFCIDIAKAEAYEKEFMTERYDELMNFETSNQFSDKEKAALSYVSEVNTTKNATNDTFNRLKKYFTDEQIVEITILNAMENYYNYVNIPLGIESDDLCSIAQ